MKLTIKQLRQMIQEELSEVEHLGGHSGGGVGVPGEWQGEEKDFVLKLMHHMVDGNTGQPFTPEQIVAMDPKAVSDLASQLRDTLRKKGAKQIPPMSDPGAFDPLSGK